MLCLRWSNATYFMGYLIFRETKLRKFCKIEYGANENPVKHSLHTFASQKDHLKSLKTNIHLKYILQFSSLALCELFLYLVYCNIVFV